MAGKPEATAEAVRDASSGGVDYAIEATGRPEAMEAAFLSTRTRGAAVLIGIPRPDAMLPPGDHDSPYGTARPRLDLRLDEARADFPHALDLYRQGRLPLDRLVSHRLPLEEAERGFELMHSGDALRVVLEL